ncbi:hypothetical protein [Pedobacter sp. KLB.chiD]|uniref:hypothetical protein n=1 Tax=Pedobacter sp. KLB.chiD TaxID=3387402 RepID=UPI00399A3D31
MQKINWGKATPEGANVKDNEFFYVYNHDLTSIEKIDRTIRFVLGRLKYYDQHLPANPKHIIKFDLRGQNISDETCHYIKCAIYEAYNRYEFLEIQFIKHVI